MDLPKNWKIKSTAARGVYQLLKDDKVVEPHLGVPSSATQRIFMLEYIDVTGLMLEARKKIRAIPKKSAWSFLIIFGMP